MYLVRLWGVLGVLGRLWDDFGASLWRLGVSLGVLRRASMETKRASSDLERQDGRLGVSLGRLRNVLGCLWNVFVHLLHNAFDVIF